MFQPAMQASKNGAAINRAANSMRII
jgi:hypothetical protein